jgi:hypothetical protein
VNQSLRKLNYGPPHTAVLVVFVACFAPEYFAHGRAGAVTGGRQRIAVEGR